MLAAHAAFLAARAPKSRAAVRALTDALQREFQLDPAEACEVVLAWLDANDL